MDNRALTLARTERSHRMSLSIGGDDISEFLYVLLKRIRFPYKEVDLNRLHDWAVIEDLKCRICTLNEVSNLVFVITYHFDISSERSGAECV